MKNVDELESNVAIQTENKQSNKKPKEYDVSMNDDMEMRHI